MFRGALIHISSHTPCKHEWPTNHPKLVCHPKGRCQLGDKFFPASPQELKNAVKDANIRPHRMPVISQGPVNLKHTTCGLLVYYIFLVSSRSKLDAAISCRFLSEIVFPHLPWWVQMGKKRQGSGKESHITRKVHPRACQWRTWET